MTLDVSDIREIAKLLRLYQNRMGPYRPIDAEDAQVWDRINRACQILGKGDPDFEKLK